VRDIVAPAGTVSVSLQLVAVSCSLQTATIVHTMTGSLLINYTDTSLPAQVHTQPPAVVPGSIGLVAARLQYHSTAAEIKKMEWMPMEILSAAG
jgi:hypothetical protein